MKLTFLCSLNSVVLLYAYNTKINLYLSQALFEIILTLLETIGETKEVDIAVLVIAPRLKNEGDKILQLSYVVIVFITDFEAMSATTKSRLEEILSDVSRVSGLECDGFTRVAFTLLERNGITCKAFVGRLDVADGVIPLHFWLEVDEFIIDYKAQMWLGEHPDVPHGVMHRSEVSKLYQGDQISMEPLPETIYKILLAGF